METKTCTQCKIEKELNKNNFTWREDFKDCSPIWEGSCKNCSNTYKANWYQIKKYIKNHPSNKDNSIIIFLEFLVKISIKENHRYCNICFTEKELNENNFYFRKSARKWACPCKICYLQQGKQYNENNKNKRAQAVKKRRKEDIFYKIMGIASSRISKMLKSQGGSKSGKSCRKYFSFSVEQLKNHIKQLFTDPNYSSYQDHNGDYWISNRDNNGNFWMNESNQGIYNPKTWDDNDSSTWTWQLDHIIPHSKLKYDTMTHPNFKKAWDLSNLRPYSAKQNNKDRDR